MLRYINETVLILSLYLWWQEKYIFKTKINWKSELKYLIF